jgi:PKD repeat protein
MSRTLRQQPLSPFDHVSRAVAIAWAVLAFAAMPPAIEATEIPVIRVSSLPLVFEPNVGQAAPGVDFVARAGSIVVLVRGDRLDVWPARLPEARRGGEATGPSAVRFRWVGARAECAIEPVEQQPAKLNFYLGTQPSRWRTDVPTFGRLRLQGLYGGVDLELYGNESELEYDLVVAPGADPTAIEMAVESVGPSATPADLRVDADGNLRIATPFGEVVQRTARVYQTVGGSRVHVASRYELRGEDRVGFCLESYDPGVPLVIDPTLVFSTYLGGSGTEFISRVATDGSGNAIVAGSTTSTNLPTVNASDISANGKTDLLVAKYTPNGLLSYLTYVGGSGDEPVAYGCTMTFDMAVDGAGNVVVTGHTTSSNYPTLAAFDSTLSGGWDLFVTKLNTLGQIVFSSYLGGDSYECNPHLAVDVSNNVLVTGHTESTSGFPFKNAFDITVAGRDVFVTKLTPAGAIVYSTALGGPRTEEFPRIAVDGSGNAIVAGDNYGGEFPLTGSADTTFNGDYDVFAVKITPTGGMVWGTYLGGNVRDLVSAVAVDGSGNALITGGTSSANFPVVNAADSTYGEGWDSFVTKLSPAGAIAFSTYLGGSAWESGNSIVADGSGNAVVLGSTTSTNFPTVNAFDKTGEGGNSSDFTVTKLSPAGAIVYSTYLGGGTSEYIDTMTDIVVDGAGNAIVAGYTYSLDFPLANPVDSTRGGTFEAFVASFNPSGGANYSTYLGGSGDEFSTATGRSTISVAVDLSGNAVVVGYTNSTDFPLANAADSSQNGEWDFFVAKISGSGGCTLGCSATVPATGKVGQSVAFDSAVTPSNCTGTPVVDWDFGDSSQHSAIAKPSHQYVSTGTYTWKLTVTVSGVTCTKSGTIVISPASGCTITCNATVPATAQVGVPFSVQASCNASGCTGTPQYWWQFGETTARIPGQNITYSYMAPGSWPWNMAVEIGSSSCAKYGTVTVAAAPANRYIVPSVAHSPGAGGTQWRTDVAAVNRSGRSASLTLTYVDDTQTLVRTASLANGATVEWPDIVVSKFGLSATAANKGTLLIGSNAALALTSRTYNQATAGTYGQYYPALTVSDALAAGKVGVVPQIKKNAGFRTNLGIVNLGQQAVTVAVKLWSATGTQVGNTKQMTAQAGRWLQQDDIFGTTGAGNRDIAYATVEVQTTGGLVWAYASVIDNTTGDPTTFPIR